MPICAICSNKFGNEGIIRCQKHSVDEDGSTTDDEQEAEAPMPPPPKKKMHKATDKEVRKATGDNVASKATKEAEYTAQDLLVLAQAYIQTCENSIDGAAQKRSTFWEDVTKAFHKIKESQQQYDKMQKRKAKYNAIQLRGEFLDSDSDGDDCEVPSRTTSSLQQKWSKFLLPYVTKFIALTHKYPILSGEGMCFLFAFPLNFIFVLTLLTLISSSDKERYYNRLHLIFLRENKNIKSFDIYRPAWEFLKDSPKFLSITTATNAAPRTISTVSNDESNNETPPGSEWVTPQASLDKRPIGKKLAKRMEQEEKILSNVTEKLKETFNNNNNGNATGTFLASALQCLTTTIAKGLQSWNERQAYSNASPTLKRKYDNLVLRARIRELEQDDDATSTNNSIVLMADAASFAQRHHDQRTIPVAASSKNNVDDDDDDGVTLAPSSVPAISVNVDDDLTQSQF